MTEDQLSTMATPQVSVPLASSESTSSMPGTRRALLQEDDPVTISRIELQRLIQNQEEMLKKQQFLEERLAFESRGRKKLRPTLKLKNTVHTIYNGLVENGQTWDTSKPFGHAINVEINDEIKKA
ncbi:uncharacterized protein [Ptychodera flava]